MTASGTRAPLGRRARPAAIPLSLAQRRFWFLNRLTGPSPNYNEPIGLRFFGQFDADAAMGALRDVLSRHEILRTVFPEFAGVPRQEVLEMDRLRLDVPMVEAESSSLQERVREAARRVFDLRSDLPLRAQLLKFAPDDYVLLMVFHHIAIDAWSIYALLIPELLRAYHARARGSVVDLPTPSVQYTDFALWQLDVLGSEDDPASALGRQVKFWKDELSGLPPLLYLPADRPRPAVSTYEGGNVSLRIEGELHTRLLGIARDRRASLFMLLHAAVAVLLWRLGAGEDIPIGAPLSGRTPAAKDIIGCFANTIVIRADTSGNPTFLELLEQVRRTVLGACVNADLPFDRIVNAVQPRRALSHNPLFQVLLGLLTITPVPMPQITQTEVVRMALRFGTHARFDLMFDLAERRGPGGVALGVRGTVQYAHDLFDRGSVQNIVHRFVRLLESIVSDPSQRIGQIDLLLPEERERLLGWSRGPEAQVAEGSWIEQFDKQVACQPDAIAIVCDGRHATYAGVNARADRLARRLAKYRVGPGDVVPFVVPRSEWSIIGLLAVLKTGAAVMPLDPEQPDAYLHPALSQVRPRLILTTTAAAPVVTRDYPLCLIDCEEGDVDRAVRLPRRQWHEDDTLYVVCTAGSSDGPRAVGASCRNGRHAISAVGGVLPLRAGDRILASTSAGTIAGLVEEMVAPLLAGATIVLVLSPDVLYSSIVRRICDDERVTVVHGAPRFVRTIAGAGPAPSGARAVVHSEPLTRDTADAVQRAGGSLATLYSTTETAFCAGARVSDPKDAPAWLGSPLPNSSIYVLDGKLDPAPQGVPGAIYVGGQGVTHGYVHEPALTAQRYLPDPFGEPGSRMVSTGDTGRWRHDGSLDLFRSATASEIELAVPDACAVEAALRESPGVADAVVQSQLDESGDRRLVAFIVETTDGTADPQALGHRLSTLLPGHLVPEVFLAIGHVPLTAGGRLDPAGLPDATFDSASRRQPGTPAEERICRLFSEVLNVDDVGPDDNFFAIGGHSLLVLRLIDRALATLGLAIDVRTVFESPTPARLAGLYVEGISAAHA